MADKSTDWKLETAFKTFLASVEGIPAPHIALSRDAKLTPYTMIRARARRDGLPNTHTPVYDVEIEVATDSDATDADNVHAANFGLLCETVLIPDLRTQLNAQGVENLTVYGFTELSGGPREIEERKFVSRLNLAVIAAGIANGLT
jgi:hypothetical protein